MARLFVCWMLMTVTSVVAACSTPVEAGTPRPESEVGLSCTLDDERQPSFRGASESEIMLQGEPDDSSLCLVNHFRGRVSCPYGQSQADYDSYAAGAIDSTDPRLCRIYGGTEVVEGPVPPQIVERRPDLSVYRSCRCAGADGLRDDGTAYCDCPSGFTCSKLIDALPFPGADYTGSYCIVMGTEFDPAQPKTDCSASTGNCGYEGQNP
jgi:hypothetical protein